MTSDSSRELEQAQKNQKQVGSAESEPSTVQLADKLREEAAEYVDEDEESSEPA
jgi:predicted house-cleaning noncanonical NTP pyrophosphatase (MazG superfamily)